MKKLFLLIIVGAIIYFVYKSSPSHQTSPVSSPSAATISPEASLVPSKPTAEEIHCQDVANLNQITAQTYSLASEVFSPEVMLLECQYQNTQSIANVSPTISYKVQLTNDANGLWNRQQAKSKTNSTYQESSNYSAAFAVLNPVKEIAQGTFYGYATGKYVELNYTPVADGNGPLFDHGMQILEKVLGN